MNAITMRRLAAAAVLLAGIGCQNPFTSDRIVRLTISEIAAPSEVAHDASLPLTLTVVTGGCRSFDRLELVDHSSTHIVFVAYGRDAERRGTSCPTDIRFEPHTYEAPPPFSDPLTVIARQPDNSEMSRVVRVR